MSLELYEKLVKRITGLGVSINVTHYVLSLGAQDGTTGIYAKSFAAGATIEMVIVGRAAMQTVTSMGVIFRSDAVGFTKDATSEGDEIKNDAGTYYVIDSIKAHYIGDQLIFYECQLTHMPLHE